MTAFSEAAVAATLRDALTEKALIATGQLIQHVPGLDAQQRLTNIFKRRHDQLKPTKQRSSRCST